MAKDTAAYLYCVVKSARRPAAARTPDGLEGATRPEAHEVRRGLWLIAATVPLAEYGPGRLEPRLQDLDWVATAAVAHEAVVEHFARGATATVIPAKLFTMFSSVDKAIADVAGRAPSIDRVMKRIAGCEEWGVRVIRKPGIAVSTGAAPSPGPVSGVAFLAAKKAARDATADARAAAVAVAESAFRALARRARDARSRERRPEPGSNPPILEAAFLVTTASRAKFKAEARRQLAACHAAGADLALTGPWPAYNFVGDPK
jgi:hypothetical protein